MQTGGGGALNTTVSSAAAGLTSSNGSSSSASAAQSSSGSSDSDSAGGNNVKVVVRCRPPTESERRGGDVGVIGCLNSNEVHVLGSGKAKSAPSSNKKVYTFDQSYGALSSQEEVYTRAVQPLVEEVLAGFNCTVFAYGQTGTGKTYTMEGELTSDIASKHAGVIPRSVHTIFDVLENQSLEYSVKVSFLELYNEELTDLLADDEGDDGHKELRIFEDTTGKRGMLVNNLEEVIVTSAEQVFQALQRSWQKRRTAETLLNKNSSRSHCVFIITVHTKECDEDGEDIIKTGKLYLVDLAGSECVGKSGAQNQRAKEAGKINQSLLTLGRVINALVDKSSYIPYRDSKLTRLLQESLGGRAKTVIIATVSPSLLALDETLSTLEYAHRAKNIRNRPQVNQKMSKRAYMKDLLAEINSLKRDNEALRLKNGIFLPPEKYELMVSQQRGDSLKVEELMFNIKAKEAEVEQLTKDVAEKDSAITSISAERAITQQQLSDTQTLLTSTEQTLRGCERQLQQTAQQLHSTQQQLQAEQVRVEEGEMIIRERTKTEEALKQQSTQLLRTVELVLSATEQLHDKVDRKTTVERSNADSLAALTESVSLQHAAIAQQVRSFHSQYQRSHQVGHQQLAGMEAASTRYLSEHESAVSGWLSQWAAQKAEVALKHSAYAAAADEQFEQFGRQAEQAAQEADESMAVLQESTHKSAVELQRRMDRQRSEQQAALGCYSQRHQEQIDSTTAFCDKSVHSLGAVDSASSTSMSGSSDELSSCASFLSDFQARHIEQSASLRAALVSQLTAMVERFERQQSDAVRDAVAAVEQRLTAQVSKQDEERQQLGATVASLVSNVKQWSSAQQTQLKEQQSDIKQTADRWKQAGTDMDCRLAAINSEVQSGLTDMRCVAQSECGAVLGQRDKWAESLHSYSADHAQHLQHIDGVQSAFARRFNSSAQHRAADDSRQIEQLESTMTGLATAVCGHVECTVDACSQLHASVVSYRSTEYRTDTPTGRTPEKRKIEYINQFAATAPHDTLLAQYRNHKKFKGGRTSSHSEPADNPMADHVADSSVEVECVNSEELLPAATIHCRHPSASSLASLPVSARSHSRAASGGRDSTSSNSSTSSASSSASTSSSNQPTSQQSNATALSSIPVLSMRSTTRQQTGNAALSTNASNTISVSKAATECGAQAALSHQQQQNENVPPPHLLANGPESSVAMSLVKSTAAAPNTAAISKPVLRSTSRLRFAPSQPPSHAD